MMYAYDGTHLVAPGFWTEGLRLAMAVQVNASLVSAVLNGTSFEVTTGRALSAAEQATLGVIVAAHADAEVLVRHRLHRIEAFNKVTEDILRQGFVHGGVTLSLSPNAQSKYTAAAVADMAGALVYPLKFDSMDDLTGYEVPDAADLWALYGAAMAAARGAIGGGSDLKQLVRDAITHTAIAAVTDNR